MRKRHHLLVLMVATALVVFAMPALSQTTGAGAPASGIGLTADHKRTIYREIGDSPTKPLAEQSRIAIGEDIPGSVMLNEMPIAVKDRVGLLRDFKFAKLPDRTIIIVDPAQRRIVDIVTEQDGAQ